MKKFLWILAFSVALLMLAGHALAAETTAADLETGSTAKLENSLGGDAKEILGGMTVTDALNTDKSLSALWKNIQRALTGTWTDTLKNGASVVVIGLFSQLVSAFCGGNKKVAFAASAACVLAVATVTVGSAVSFAKTAGQAVDDMNTFSKVLLPTLTAAAVSSGAVTSASVRYAASALFMDVLITVVEDLILPLIFAYLAVALADAVLEQSGLSAAARLLKWIIGIALSLLVLAFTTYLTVTGVIAASTDAAATKLAKATLSSLLPVVGSILSDAAGTVVSGMEILKNAVGAFGIFAVLAICAVPCAKLLLQFLIYKAAAAVSAAAADPRVVRMIDAVSGAYAMLFGTVGTAALILFISMISFLKAVTVT